MLSIRIILFSEKSTKKCKQKSAKRTVCNADIARAADGGGSGPVPAGEHQQPHCKAAPAVILS